MGRAGFWSLRLVPARPARLHRKRSTPGTRLSEIRLFPEGLRAAAGWPGADIWGRSESRSGQLHRALFLPFFSVLPAPSAKLKAADQGHHNQESCTGKRRGIGHKHAHGPIPPDTAAVSSATLMPDRRRCRTSWQSRIEQDEEAVQEVSFFPAEDIQLHIRLR